MRQVLFRAKTLNEGKWVYGMTIGHGTIDRKKHNLYMEVAPDKWKGIDPETVGQFTGLLDKNGKEIYEGDILGCPEDNYFLNKAVIFTEGCFMVKDEYTTTPMCAIDAQYRTVIGNIHDNPELISDKQ